MVACTHSYDEFTGCWMRIEIKTTITSNRSIWFRSYTGNLGVFRSKRVVNVYRSKRAL
jgi:hypothetical protein